MFSELAIKLQEYLEQGVNLAVAQVIDRSAPSSSKVTDKAIILESGELVGWIGGGCVFGRGPVIGKRGACFPGLFYHKVNWPRGFVSNKPGFG